VWMLCDIGLLDCWTVGLREVRGDTPTPCSQSRLACVFVLLIIWDGRQGQPG
jgi:hypothetical protein